MARNLRFEGVEELAQVLDGLAGEGRLGSQVVGKILRKAAKPVVEEARRLAPREDGDLQKSIGVIAGRGAGKGQQVYVGPRRGGGFKGYAGHLVEYGTQPHVIRAAVAGGTLHLRGNRFAEEVQHPGAAAKPFMRPAADAKLPESVQIIKDECLQIIASDFKTINFK